MSGIPGGVVPGTCGTPMVREAAGVLDGCRVRLAGDTDRLPSAMAARQTAAALYTRGGGGAACVPPPPTHIPLLPSRISGHSGSRRCVFLIASETAGKCNTLSKCCLRVESKDKYYIMVVIDAQNMLGLVLKFLVSRGTIDGPSMPGVSICHPVKRSYFHQRNFCSSVA